MVSSSTSSIKKLYDKYAYLVVSYARKIKLPAFCFFEKEDIEQELRIRLYTSIQTYALKYAEWKETGRYQPVPIEFYLRTAMKNKIADIANNLYKKKENNPNYKVSIETDSFDVGVMQNNSSFVSTEDFYINGCNVFENLEDEKERSVFLLFLHGFKKKEICEKLKCEAFLVANIIDRQIMYIRENMKDIFDQQNNTLYYTFDTSEN